MSETNSNGTTNRFNTFKTALKKREQQHRLRGLSPVATTSDQLNFCSNDYLGLADHPTVKARSAEYLEKWGSGATASRLVSGTFSIHQELEQQLAEFTYRKRALVFNSGYQANSTIIPAITDRNTLLLTDKNAHNSLLFGARASRGRLLRFRHNDVDDLNRLIHKFGSDYEQILIITESVFSMDGDRAPLADICEIADQCDALLYVDDAHAIGILGTEGRGLATKFERIDLLIGTFGKAFGASGAFVAGSDTMIDFLINFCAGFIYTTGIPPATVGAISAALELIPELDSQRRKVYNLADELRRTVHELGWETAGSSTQIVPAIIGSDEEALRCSQYLAEQGILCSAIRPPTVPENTARLRFTITSDHTESDLRAVNTQLKTYNGV